MIREIMKFVNEQDLHCVRTKAERWRLTIQRRRVSGGAGHTSRQAYFPRFDVFGAISRIAAVPRDSRLLFVNNRPWQNPIKFQSRFPG